MTPIKYASLIEFVAAIAKIPWKFIKKNQTEKSSGKPSETQNGGWLCFVLSRKFVKNE